MVINVLHDKQVDALHQAMDEVYEDRLVAESYIYSLSKSFHNKKWMILDCSPENEVLLNESAMLSDNKSIREIMNRYEATRLTQEEFSVFTKFKNSVQTLGDIESDFIKSLGPGNTFTADKVRILAGYDNVFNELALLSEIQIKEGSLLRDKAKRLVSGHALLGNVELIFVILIGIIILNMIFAARTLKFINLKSVSLN